MPKSTSVHQGTSVCPPLISATEKSTVRTGLTKSDVVSTYCTALLKYLLHPKYYDNLWNFLFNFLLFFLNLAAPSINIAPPPNIEVEIGGYFTIICEAVGTPTPLIVWRLNWGNIPTGDRVHVSSINGRGNLTITNARVEDSGAYTCEAINVRGSIFASPDAIIIVRRKLTRWG